MESLRFSQLINIIVCLLFLLEISEVRAENAPPNKKKENYILILSSHQYNNPWSTSVSKGIQKYLEQENSMLISRTVYGSLDIQETMLASRLNMQKAFTHARLTPTILIPRVLVLVDDESWMLYRIMNLRGLWEKIPVVLCGVHDEILKDYSNFFTPSPFTDSLLFPISKSRGKLPVTGVMRANNYDQTIHLVESVCPDAHEIVYISNGSYGDEYAWWQQQKSLSALRPGIKQSYFNSCKTPEDTIQHYLNTLSSSSAVVLFNSLPVFLKSLHLPSITLQDGATANHLITAGHYATTDQFARQTAKLILDIHNGKSTDELPFQYVEELNFRLNEQSKFTERIELQIDKLPSIVYYNALPLFFFRYLREVISVLAFLSVCFMGALVYIRHRRYRKHIQSMLAKYKVLHEKFQVIYDNMPIALLIFDEKGQLLQKNGVNWAFQEMWLKNRSTELRLDTLFNDPKLQEKIANHETINQILIYQNGEFQQDSTEQNGDECDYYRLILRYVPDESSSGEHTLVILINNTDIYREQVANKRIRNVFNFAMNKAGIGVAEYNPYTLEGSATETWYKHLELPSTFPQPYLSAFKYVEEDDRQDILRFYNNACLGKSHSFNKEIRVTNEQGVVHHLRQQVKVTDYHPENTQMWMVELNQNIDAEREFSREIEAATFKAQEAERLKNTFIANMSHEIRSPLNVIIGFSNLIATETDLEVRQEMIHHIEDSNEVLLRQINDIIDLSKMESGSMTFSFSETNINTLFRDISTIFQMKIGQKKLSLTYCCPLEELSIITDKVRVRQVISNFISNAIKYSEKGEIQFGYQLDSQGFYVYVKDTGIGIPSEKVARVFDRFFRVTNNMHGYGLGLAISQAVVDGLNGEIGVESEEGVGSTFWFRLPVEIIKATEHKG